MAYNSKKNVRRSSMLQVYPFKLDDAIIRGILNVISNTKIWTGTMTNLKNELVRQLGKNKALPRSPSALRMVLNRVVYRLRTRGVSVKFGRTTDHARTRYVRFAR